MFLPFSAKLCSCLGGDTSNKVPNILVGDGDCNNETNIEACNFDGGDCCTYESGLEMCKHLKTCEAGYHPLVGDGYCNDETNNADCDFDGGDCCGTCINKDHCSNCECLGGITGNGVPNILVGNGVCNEETNNKFCHYDGFDCCGLDFNEDECHGN